MRKLSVKTIVAIAIGAALFFVLGRYVAIPSPVPNTTICIQYGLLAFMAAVYGPVAGLLIGFIGHFFIDFSWGWGVWYSWVIASAFFGGAMGLLTRKTALDEGVFAKKDMVTFVVGTVVAHLLAWAVVAPVLDILIYAEPANKVFLQGLVSAASNIVTTLILGLILCYAYAAAKPKAGSLNKE
ncbi:MAG: ECF-type riboflavin transporter substrate-binding protein [Clostridia bacterium]|nr:ECF-type riboflavin transporter substrate-binding protein [Clostridia bacterium]